MKEEFLAYKLNNMSLSEKIGQMIIIDYRSVTEMTVDLEKILTQYNPGGFILFNRSNVVDFEQTRKLLDDIKNATNIKGFMAVDQEGGRVQRLSENVGFEKYPPMLEIGETKDPSRAFELGVKMGAELKSIGIDMDMAPVLDIFSNPKNTAIGDRAFGKTSEDVVNMAFAFSDGLNKEGIIPVGKHFPGHGGTLKDSHASLPFVDKDLNELNEFELVPFKEAVNKKLPGIMVGHLAVPKVTGDNMPASLSETMINGVLRTDMGYDGLIMTDSLKMKGLKDQTITNTLESPDENPPLADEDIYIRCVQAGNDFILMPQDINEAFNTIYRKVNEGLIPESRIEESVYRILSTKFDYGFFDKEYKAFLELNSSRGRRR